MFSLIKVSPHAVLLSIAKIVKTLKPLYLYTNNGRSKDYFKLAMNIFIRYKGGGDLTHI